LIAVTRMKQLFDHYYIHSLSIVFLGMVEREKTDVILSARCIKEHMMCSYCNTQTIES